MLIYYNLDIDLETQITRLITILKSKIKVENAKLDILLECLKNLNTVIQEAEYMENPTKITNFLRILKKNLDNLRNSISNLEFSQSLLEDLFKNMENPSKIEEYNTFATNLENKFLSVDYINIDKFIFEYIRNATLTFKNNLSEKNFLPSIEEKIIDLPKTLETDLLDNTLLISEIQNKVVLPYSINALEEKLHNNNEYKNMQDIINYEYTIPLDRYKNSSLSRFRETYNLMRKKENSSVSDSLDLAIELAFNNLLNPAIITACKNLDELDIYLDCLASNELDKFKFFNIKYEILPKKYK